MMLNAGVRHLLVLFQLIWQDAHLMVFQEVLNIYQRSSAQRCKSCLGQALSVCLEQKVSFREKVRGQSLGPAHYGSVLDYSFVCCTCIQMGPDPGILRDRPGHKLC